MIIYYHVEIHSYSCIPVLIFTLIHVYLCWYSYMVMCLHVDIHIWSCISVLIVTPCHIPTCWYPFVHVYHAWYSNLVMCPHFDIYTYSRIFLLILSLGQGSPSWYLHMFKYCCAAVLTWSCVPVLIFTLVHGSPISILSWLCVPILIFTHCHVFMCWYFHIIINLPLDIHPWSGILALILFGHGYLCCNSHLVVYNYIYILNWPCILCW